MTSGENPNQVVEVRPEVVFIYELLDELTNGRIRIPRFQRPFVWRRDQMTDLLDSVFNQYPIGSLLVWETDTAISTLHRLGPFVFPEGEDTSQAGYLLDGHQRLSTLAGALVAREDQSISSDEDEDRWHLAWNMETEKFQHGRAENQPGTLFPLTSLLDTLKFFAAVDGVRRALSSRPDLAEKYVAQVSRVARAFQHYRVPVIRIRQTGLSEAVEIFARLNSKGQSMSADQMVSALMYSSDGSQDEFDLASEIDSIIYNLGQLNFGDIDRTAVLRAILANLDEDIYNTDWTRLAEGRRKDLGDKLRKGVDKAAISLNMAVSFLQEQGVAISRLLPYSMQLVVLSAAFDAVPNPDVDRLDLLKRWFWVSSFSGWFGGANPSRVNSLVTELRRTGNGGFSGKLDNFDLNAASLPYPTSFDMRSARTRSLLLVMLSLRPRDTAGEPIIDPWSRISQMGPSGVGYIFDELPKAYSGNPANRMIRPPGAPNGVLSRWIVDEIAEAGDEVLWSYCLNAESIAHLKARDVPKFVLSRQSLLIDAERRFRASVGVAESSSLTGGSPIDTD